MANSTCPKCARSWFEVKEAEPTNSQYKIVFVQCSGCGTVVGTMPYYDAGVVSKQNQEEIAQIKEQLRKIRQSLSQIVDLLERLK